MSELKVSEIIKLIIKDKQYIFNSFNDHRISEVQQRLIDLDLDYIETSQTGNDFVFAIYGSSFYRKFHGEGLEAKHYKWHQELLEEIKEDTNFEELSKHVHLQVYDNLKAVHRALLVFLENGPIKNVTNYSEAADVFYGHGCGKGASLIEDLMRREGIAV